MAIGLASVHPSETTAGRKSALKRGLAIPPATPGGAPGFPVTDAAHWDKARQAIGRVKNPARRAAVGRLLRKTAPQFGKTKELGESWAAKGKAGYAKAGKANFAAGRAKGIAALKAANKARAHSNTGPAMEFAMPRIAVASPYDLIITRGDDGSAVVRHRRGGGEITRIRRTDDGTWVAAVDGRDLQPHTRQRGALLEAIGVNNRQAGTPYHRPESAPLQPPPEQTPLMERFGIPAIRANLATPTVGASDGPRMTTDDNGLSPRGQAIAKKLVSRGFPHPRAVAFAKRAQNKVKGQGFGRSRKK